MPVCPCSSYLTSRFATHPHSLFSDRMYLLVTHKHTTLSWAEVLVTHFNWQKHTTLLWAEGVCWRAAVWRCVLPCCCGRHALAAWLVKGGCLGRTRLSCCHQCCTAPACMHARKAVVVWACMCCLPGLSRGGGALPMSGWRCSSVGQRGHTLHKPHDR